MTTCFEPTTDAASHETARTLEPKCADGGDRWPTVLCIDDDPEISHILQLRLREFRIDVIRAYSGTQGLWLALNSHPEAIITDLAMPHGTGDFVLKSLKSNPKTAQIPVIVFTGRQNEGLYRRLENAGAAAILAKPVNFQQILDALSVHIKI
jgi:DNA-binding response OmpR family regulator